jgi:hypothetical protein
VDFATVVLMVMCWVMVGVTCTVLVRSGLELGLGKAVVKAASEAMTTSESFMASEVVKN